MRRVRIVACTIALAVAILPFRPPAAAPRCYPTDRFVFLADGMVRDTLTSLIWQQDGSGARAGCGGSSQLTCSWAEAQAYCADLSLGGHLDWRLPTVKELRSIVDHTVRSPAINLTAFPNTPSESFWTSSPYAGSSGNASYVDFSYGVSKEDGVGIFYRVRCVR